MAKRRIRWLAVTLLALLAVLLTVAALPGRWRGPTAEQTAEAFLAALGSGDTASLLALLEADTALTEQMLSPLVAGGRDEAFLTAAAAMMAQPPSPEALFWLDTRGSGLGSRFVVRVATAEVVVQSNLPGAAITVGEHAAAWEPSREAAVVRGLLPGRYQVRGVASSPQGGEFQAEEALLLTQPATACQLEFDYSTLEIYNNAASSVRIQVDGSDYATLDPQQELVLEPVTPEVQVTAVGPGEQTLSATGADGYFYVSFAACRLEIYNDYQLPMHVALDGRWYADIPPLGKLTLEGVPPGQQVRAYLDEAWGLEPFQYQAAYDFDYLYPTFALGREAYDALRLTAETYALVAYESLGKPELDALPQTALTYDLAALLASEEVPKLTAREITLAGHGAPQPHEDGTMDVRATVQVVELREGLGTEPGAEPEPPLEQERQWPVTLQWREGLWNVLPEPPPVTPQEPEPPPAPEPEAEPEPETEPEPDPAPEPEPAPGEGPEATPEM